MPARWSMRRPVWPYAVSMLQGLELMQDRVAVERLDVARLSGGQAAHRPRQVNEVRLDRVREGMHADLVRQTVPLARVAGRAGSDDVRPVVRAAAGDRDDVVTRERLARPELDRRTAAILAAVVIAREEERVRHLPTKSP